MNKYFALAGMVAVSAVMVAGPLSAQGPGMGPGGGMGPGSGPGMTGPGMGPGMSGRGGGMMMGRGMMMGGCMMMGDRGEAHAAGRIAFLKAELAIKDAQQPAFDAYAAALKSNIESMKAMHETMWSAMEKGTPSDRLSAHIGVMEKRVAALKQVQPALEKLYAALDDDQKKKADDLLTGIGCMM